MRIASLVLQILSVIAVALAVYYNWKSQYVFIKSDMVLSEDMVHKIDSVIVSKNFAFLACILFGAVIILEHINALVGS